MRIYSLGLLCVYAAGMALAGTTETTEKAAIGYGSPEQKIAMWIWSDKYTYRAGENLTLKWTVKTNGDLYPYTTYIYRQNNQTGKKVYLPANSETLPDNVNPASVKDAAKADLATVSVPDEPGMHTLVVQLRDYSGTRVLKAAYMKIGVVTEQVTVSAPITTNTTWVNTKSYLIRGIVPVKNGATLTIEPGTIVQGASGSEPPSALIVTREGKIAADGTKSRPIVFTSAQPFGQRKRGDWGGLVMLGKAPINVAANTNGNTNGAGTFYIEGMTASDDGLYGGADENHNCGSLSYVRVEYAGSILSPNNELNSFTWGGCGKGTKVHHLQALYGLDDSFEWFGGTMDAKYLIGGLGADDYVDYQLGWTGRLQYGIFYQSPDSRGNRGVEGDNSEYNNAATPFSNPTMYNLTFIGSGQPGFDEANSPGIFLRRGARATINNVAVTNFYSSAVEFTDANTQAQMDQGNIVMNGFLAWNNNLGANGANTLTGQIANAPTLAYAQGTRGDGAAKNFVVTDPMLLRPFEYSDPNFRGRFGSPLFRAGWVSAPDDGFFDQTATFIGGIGDDDWTEEWTNLLTETDI
ncbi:MAG TPA: hypothetical protein VFQ91_07945 [Bryobacteraceae bacterium]|nr:hypothetical protein [Bryobacteraceae bacterium]